jgi:hypothetical protein
MDTQIENIIREFSPGDELEIRLGYFKDGDKFHSAITSFMFYYALKQFSEISYKIARQVQTIYMDKNQKLQERIKTIITTDEVVTIIKKIKVVEDFQQLGLRVALSSEKISNETLDLQNTIQKERTRTTFYGEEYNYKIDLTMDQQDRFIHYQLEVEFIKGPSAQELKNMILWLHSFRQNLYQNQKVISSFNRHFIQDPKYKRSDKDMPFNGGVMPKNLKPYLVPFLNEYVITSKPNGISYFLYFSSKYGMYYINRTEIYLVSENPTPYSLAESIVIGEFINKKFYAFDFLIYKGQDVRNKSATERHQMLNIVQKIVGWTNFEILPLFYTGNLTQDLKAAFRYIESEWTPETNDGIILKPQNLPFNNPYVYKWKPLDDVTIDLSVRKINEEHYGFAYDHRGLIPFEGSEKFPYSGRVDLAGLDVPEYTIIEFKYEAPYLRAVRIRADKVKPNFIRVAISTWEDIHVPFSKEELIELSEFIIKSTDNLADITRKICGFLKTTKDPRIFEELNEYIDTDIVTKLFKGAANLGVKRNMGNELVPIISDYFSKLSVK